MNVAMNGTWTGNNLKVTAKLWNGKITKTATLNGSFSIDSVSVDDSMFNDKYAILNLTITEYIDGQKKDRSTTFPQVYVGQISDKGWKLAYKSIAYTAGAKTITLPDSGYDTTQAYDISETYNAATLTKIEVAGDPAATATTISVKGTRKDTTTPYYALDVTAYRTKVYNSVTVDSIAVDGSISIGDTTINLIATASNTKTKTWTCNAINVWKGGYAAASDKVNYTAGAKSITVPTGNNGGTTPYDITATYDAGYKDGKTDYKPDNITINVSEKKVSAINGAGDTVGGPYTVASVYNQGWNDCLAACSAVSDAYKKSGTTTASYSGSGSKKCSEGHTVNYDYSGTVTIDNYVTYSGLYTLPAGK